MNKQKIVEQYRKAAQSLWPDLNGVETETYILHPDDDRGRNAPGALAIIYLEADCRQEGDAGILPSMLDYYSERGIENCVRLGGAVPGTYVEYINAAVAAVYES